MIRPKYRTDTFPAWTTLPIRFRDLDPLNHVNNALFSTYYEEARIHFIQQVPEFNRQVQSGFSFVLAAITIDFLRPAEYPGNLLVGSGIKELGNSRITSFQAIYTEQDKKLLSVAEASGVWYNLDRKRPSRLPEFNNIEKYILDSELFD